MRFSIGEQQTAIIDTYENRSMVINHIVQSFKDGHKATDAVTNYMDRILEGELTNKTLYQLLLIDAEDADAIVWENIFDHLIFCVSERVYGAEDFFAVGRDATLNGDKWYDEYQGLFKRNYTNGGGLIEENTYEFCREFVDKRVWNAVVTDVCDYVRKVTQCECKWVAFSHDYAFEGGSKETFTDKKECYNAMRDAVLSKMKWNTEYDEDFTEGDDAVEYKVRFEQGMIIHESYSGVYVYKIVGKDEKVAFKDVFTDEFKAELKRKGFGNIVGWI